MAVLNEPHVEEKAKVGTLKISLDPIHSGMRVAVFGSFVGAGIVTFAAGLMLIPNGAMIAIILSAASAAGTSMGVEHLLKDKWPSGREFVADQERIALTKHNKIESVINVQEQVKVLTWRFEVKKDGPRAKKGWQLMGLGLEQDDNYVIIYTAAPQEDFDTLPIANAFKKLEKPDNEKKNKAASSRTLRQAGEQKRLHEAEVVRQLVGGDMFFADFVETIEFLQANYPQWMITD